MPPNDRVRLHHMRDAARDAVTFGAGCTEASLLKDRVLTLALVKCIEIIGEAASRITPETRSVYVEIPWGDITGMRNRLIHVYFDIDFARVCDTLAVDLPPLITVLDRILAADAE
jgi:uncharacterized protein with HEPN domain